MKKVVLINGKARSGKDTSARIMARILKENGYTVEILSFAEPLKQVIADTFNITFDELEKFKNNPTEFSVQTRTSSDKKVHVTDFRTILQRFGTEGMKPVFGNDVWARLAMEKAKYLNVDFVLIPDFRFLIESHRALSYVANDWFTVSFVNVYSNLVNSSDTHSSETELNEFDFDYYISNEKGKLKETENQIKTIVKALTE